MGAPCQKFRAIAGFLAFCTAFSLAGCSEHEESKSPKAQIPAPNAGANAPHAAGSDFLPTKPGTRWVYRITVDSTTEPMQCRTVQWPVGGGVSSVLARGRFSQLVS